MDWLRLVSIAPLTEADLGEVLAIERTAFPTPWSRGSYERELRAGNSHYFTARYLGVLVGYVGMWIIFEEAHITTLAVHPQFRRRGLGRRLLSIASDVARRGGAERMTLEVREGNRAAAALYRSAGFEEKGLLRGYYGDTGENGIVMWKMLAREGAGERA